MGSRIRDHVPLRKCRFVENKTSPQGKQDTHPVLKYRVPHWAQPRPGWAPDPPRVGIRSPIGLVVGSCTRHPGVLGSIPKREEPGKTGAPCVKVPGSSRVPFPPRQQLCNRSCSNKHTHSPQSVSDALTKSPAHFNNLTWPSRAPANNALECQHAVCAPD